MEPQGIDYFGWALKAFAASGIAAWIAAFLSNKRGGNKVLDFIMDLVELVAGNINKAKNAPDA